MYRKSLPERRKGTLLKKDVEETGTWAGRLGQIFGYLWLAALLLWLMVPVLIFAGAVKAVLEMC